MTKVEEQDSNSNDSSLKSNTSKESDNIKLKQKKNHHKKKISHSDDTISERVKKASISFWKEPCREILETLKKDKKSQLFRAPAVKSFQNQKDKDYYKDQIKEPRDLGTITKKINGDNYSPKEFYNDIELCWSNAKTFNEENTEVYDCAVYLKSLSDKLFKEKNIEEIIEKYNTEKDNFNSMGEDKENMNDNTNNSNNNTNDSNNTNDKLNLNDIIDDKKDKNSENSDDKDSGQKKDKERKKSIESNSSNDKSNKDDESYNESGHRKHHHHHKLTGKKRRRHKHKDKDKDKEKDKDNKDKDKEKKEDKDEDKKETKRGRKRKKIDNDDIIKISKKKINFDDLKKKYPINYPVIISPEEIERMAKKSGKNKIKKMIKLNNTSKNHDNHHKTDNNKKRGKNVNNDLINNLNIEYTPKNTKKVIYKFDWEFLENGNAKEVENILIENSPEYRKKENEQMANFDINCNSENVQVTHKHKNNNNHNNNHNSINGVKDITENTQKKKKNDNAKNKNNNINNNKNNNSNNNYDNTDINYITINNNDIDVEMNNSINNNNQEIIQKSNNVSIDNSINEIKMVPEINTTAVKIVEKGYEKNVESRIQLTKYFDTLTDSNFVDLLVYIENIRPQSISLLENDTIYIDMDAFNEETFNKVLDYIKNVV